MRYCEAWRLQARGGAVVALGHDTCTYDEYPSYSWNENFDIDQFAQALDHSNTSHWDKVKSAICRKLGIPETLGGFGTFSTRMLRRHVHGPDLASVQRKQITVPVIIPTGLEDYLTNVLPQEYSSLSWHTPRFRCLIPVHDPSKHDPQTTPIPSLRDTAGESGNLRFWTITNESMWAGQHPALDETADVLWPLFLWLNQRATPNKGPLGTDQSDCVWHLARYFRRCLLPESGEANIFRAWALQNPIMPNRENSGTTADESHDLFADERFLYPFPDELFWQAGDEGEWVGVGVPPWQVRENQ